MVQLERLSERHAAAVLAFERVNRPYFAAFVSDRGEDFFDTYAARHAALLANQRAGGGAYHVLVDADGSVVGRFNLIFVAPGTAELGYRVAQHAAGRGLATAAVGEMCDTARRCYGLQTIRAATSDTNVASQRVLTKSGFRLVGAADPADLGGKAGAWYERSLLDP